MTQGTVRIEHERMRQIIEERNLRDGDLGRAEVLAMAAACYAMAQEDREAGNDALPPHWPKGMAAKWWKPTPGDRIRELTKAGALLAAAIDTLIREKAEAEDAARP